MGNSKKSFGAQTNQGLMVWMDGPKDMNISMLVRVQ